METYEQNISVCLCVCSSMFSGNYNIVFMLKLHDDKTLSTDQRNMCHDIKKRIEDVLSCLKLCIEGEGSLS